MSNPKIEWIQKSGKTCLKFTFQESFGAQDAQSEGLWTTGQDYVVWNMQRTGRSDRYHLGRNNLSAHQNGGNRHISIHFVEYQGSKFGRRYSNISVIFLTGHINKAL